MKAKKKWRHSITLIKLNFTSGQFCTATGSRAVAESAQMFLIHGLKPLNLVNFSTFPGNNFSQHVNVHQFDFAMTTIFRQFIVILDLFYILLSL